MWHPDPDQLTLAALPSEEPDPGVVAHLAVCPLCAGHVASLRRTVELARAGGDAVDDGTGPPERVWRAIADELAVTEPFAGPAGPAAVEPIRAARRGRWTWKRVAVPVAATVLGIALGLGVGYVAGSTGPAEPDGPVVALLAPLDDPIDDPAPGGTGRVVMVRSGDEERMSVTLRGVGALADGDYLEVWLLDATGTRLVSLGGLTPDGEGYHGSFTVPGGLPFGEFSTVDVSVERWDGDPGHSTLSVLRGSLA